MSKMLELGLLIQRIANKAQDLYFFWGLKKYG
jgi:hypothetical protein